MQRPMDVVVDVSGAYIPVTGRGGQRPAGDAARRCVPRARHRATGATVWRRSRSSASMSARPEFQPMRSPSSSTSPQPRRVSGTGRRSRSARSRPNASNLNIDTAGSDTGRPGDRAAVGHAGVQRLQPGRRPPRRRCRRIVHRRQRRPSRTDGLFFPTNPTRLLDSRNSSAMPTWGGSTLEFPVYGPGRPGLPPPPSTSPARNR